MVVQRLIRGAWAVAIALVVPVSVAAPSTAVPALSPAVVTQSRMSLTPLMLPMFCGSLCNPGAPMLVAEAAAGGTGATTTVPLATAATGGYTTAAGTGVATAGLGGLAFWRLGLRDLLPWTYTDGGALGLGSTVAPSYGTRTVTVSGIKSRIGAGPGSITGTITVPTKGPTAWRSVSWSVEGTADLVGGVTYQLGIRCSGSSVWAPGGPVGLSSYALTDSGTRTCASPSVLTGIRLSGITLDNDPVYRYFDIADHDPAWDPTPKRYLQQTVDCMDWDGDILTRTEKGATTAAQTSWSMPTVSCPAGTMAVNVEADLIADGVTHNVGSATMPTPVRDAFRGCDPAENVGGCVLSVERADGMAVTDHDIANPRRDRLICKYGSTVLPLEWCARILHPAPDGMVTVPVEDPANPGEPKTDPVYDDPPVPDPTPTPTPPPGADPRSEGVEDVGCVHWSLGNFVTGKVIYQAAGCAIRWAFVPRPAVLEASTTQVQTVLESSAPYVAIGGGLERLNGVVVSLENMGGGCHGPTLEFADVTIDPVNLCGPPLSTYAGWVKVATTLALIVFTIMRLVSTLAASLNIRMPWDHGGSDSSSGAV